MPARLFTRGLGPQRIRVFLVLFAVALALPLVVLSILAFNRMAALEQAETERRVLQIAADLASDVDRELERATITIGTLATSDSIARRDFAKFHERASQAIKRENAGILLVDHTYQQLMNTRAPFGTKLPPTADPATAQRVFDTKQPQISDLIIGIVTRGPVINVEVPVLEGNDVPFVLIMALDASRFENLLREQGLEPQWITGIADNKGLILARSERHAEFVGKPLPTELFEQSRKSEGVFRATSVAGVQVLRGTVRSKVAGWLVSATIPVAYVDAPHRRGMLFGAALLATAVAVGSALAIVFGGFMTRPLGQAAKAATALGKGELVSPLYSPLVEANTITFALGAASKELKERLERTEFLMGELAHRSKNQLAVIQGMASQTAREAGTVDQFVKQLSLRIQGLAQSHDLMLRQNWHGAWLADLVHAHVDLFGADGRVQIDGQNLFLSANAAQNIGFALHELATNASKHGALSSPGGTVKVGWKLNEATTRLQFDWIEIGGGPIAPSKGEGFGHLVLTKQVPNSLRGKAVLDLRTQGTQWHLDVPAAGTIISAPANGDVTT